MSKIKSISISRRSLIATFATLPVISKGLIVPSAMAQSKATPLNVKALTFDTQGTMLDFYTPLTGIANKMWEAKHLKVNSQEFIIAWGGGIGARVKKIIGGDTWAPVTTVQRQALDELLDQKQLSDKFSDAERTTLVAGWSKMKPWADSIKGLSLLKRNFTVVALTNMSLPLALSVVKNSALPFDTLITSDMVKSYKPAPSVYKFAINELALPPEQILMVASHKWDLKAAKEIGFKTAFIPRPLENGPNKPVDTASETFIDITAKDVIDLSIKLKA